jgi:hypothetical protein
MRSSTLLSVPFVVALLQVNPSCSCQGNGDEVKGPDPRGSYGAHDDGGCGLRTCASAGANCGPIGDGCNSTLYCGSCYAPSTCGGAGIPSVCGGNPNSGPCVNLCPQQTSCGEVGTATTVSGTVYAPTNAAAGYGNPDPIPNVLVYVPNGTGGPWGTGVQAFTQGVQCNACGAPVTGDPLVSATTAADGTFTLTNVPSGNNIPLVMQIGRWRRQITIPNVASCANTALTADQTRMPRNHTEGDIPLMAMVTGNVDSIECVLRKMGIDDSEFTTPSGGGRVQFYVDNGASDSTGNAPPEETLTSSASTLSQYDMVIFACHGEPVEQSSTDQQNVIDYANSGGRVYTTHYSYVWLYDDMPFSSTANWAVQNDTSGSGEVDQTVQVNVNGAFPRGALLSQWLQIINASPVQGVIPLGYLRYDFTAANSPSETWLTWPQGTPSTWPLHYTFDTPVGTAPSSQCGRVVFSDFHVENQNSTGGSNFPGECDVSPLTPQEKVLEFMLFDLASCVLGSNPTLDCTPTTCAALGYECGPVGDGCGGLLDCGGCDGGTCGGSGQANQCSGSGGNTNLR